jgi:DNA-binding transcriptional regulator YiaG
MSKGKRIKARAGWRTSPAQVGDDRKNLPLNAGELRAMKRVAPIKRIRWQLGLSQEEFASRFEIPIDTLRDWEQADPTACGE